MPKSKYLQDLALEIAINRVDFAKNCHLYRTLLKEVRREFCLDELLPSPDEISNKLRVLGFSWLPPMDMVTLQLIAQAVTPKTNERFFRADAEVIYNSKVIMEFFTKPLLIRPIQRYLGIFPTLQYIAAWKTGYTANVLDSPELAWHTDFHGHKFIKIFYYLNSVKPGEGHHEFILTSHCDPLFIKTLRDIDLNGLLLNEYRKIRLPVAGYRLSQEFVKACSSQILCVSGPSGTGFAEDTQGIHRGTKFTNYLSHDRLIIQAVYTPFDNSVDPVSRYNANLDLRDLIKNHGYKNCEASKLLYVLQQE